MQNRDVAHQFFYDLYGSFNRRSMTVSYYKGKYYSYATVIGQIAETITGKTICIISNNNFSNTTAKHINELRAACPYEVVYLPQYQGSNSFYPADVVKHCIDNIEYYAKQKLSQKHNRENLSSYYEMLKNTLEIVGFENQFEKTTEILDKYKDLYKSINDPEKLKELKAKQKELEKQRQKNLKKELNEILEKYSYIDLIKFVYADKWFNDYSIESYNTQKELKTKLKKYLNPKNDLSFIWFDSDFCRTSQHITVNRKEVEALLKLWNKGKLKHGMTISYYTILEVQKEYIKVGCHKIPTTNLQALIKLMNQKENSIGA